MLILSSINDIVRLTTSAAVAITVSASWVDLNTTTGVTIPSSAIYNISTATTTTIVPAPAVGVVRNVKNVTITNTNLTTSVSVTAQHYNGTISADLMAITLLGDENLVCQDGNWTHLDMNGAPYSYTPVVMPSVSATGILAESFPRQYATTNTTAGASGTLFMQAIYLTARTIVTNLTFFSATTAAATTTNLFYGLYDVNRNLLGQTAAQGAYTWTANTKKTLALTTPYRITTSGVYYIAVLQIATTIATVLGGAAKLNAVIATDIPIIHGTSSTGQTSMPNPAAAITAGTASLYAAVS